MPSPLVTTDWLQGNLDNEQLVLIDASMTNVVGKEPITYDHPLFIPGSRRIDLEGTLCDTGSSQLHAFPTEAQFTAEARRLGIGPDSLVVLCARRSSIECFSASRSMSHQPALWRVLR